MLLRRRGLWPEGGGSQVWIIRARPPQTHGFSEPRPWGTANWTHIGGPEVAPTFFVTFPGAVVGEKAFQEGILSGPRHQRLFFQ